MRRRQIYRGQRSLERSGGGSAGVARCCHSPPSSPIATSTGLARPRLKTLGPVSPSLPPQCSRCSLSSHLRPRARADWAAATGWGSTGSLPSAQLLNAPCQRALPPRLPALPPRPQAWQVAHRSRGAGRQHRHRRRRRDGSSLLSLSIRSRVQSRTRARVHSSSAERRSRALSQAAAACPSVFPLLLSLARSLQLPVSPF